MGETEEDQIVGFINKLEDSVKEVIYLITEPREKFPVGEDVRIKMMDSLEKSKQLKLIHSKFSYIMGELYKHESDVQDKLNLEPNLNNENDLMEAKHLPAYGSSWEDQIVFSINELEDIVREIKYLIDEPTDKYCKGYPGGNEVCIKRMNILTKSLLKLDQLYTEFYETLNKFDLLESSSDEGQLEPDMDDENDLMERCDRANNGSRWVGNEGIWFKFQDDISAFENIEEISEKESSLQIISEILIKHLPMLEDPCSEIDDILYENDEHKVVEEMDRQFDPEALLPFNDNIDDIGHVYFSMVFYKNIVNQCLDNAFLKLVEHRGWRRALDLDRMILDLLESKNMYQICLGLKLCKTYSKANGFKKRIEQDLYCAISYLTKIPEFVDDQNENRMARFVAKHAKECLDLIKEKDKLPEIPAYRARDIFMKIKDEKIIGQYEISALYEIIKSCKSSSKILRILLGYGKIANVVSTLLIHIRNFFKQYEALDEEMREIDMQNGQEFGGFSLEVVVNDDMKKPLCASDGLEKSTLIKYFFYGDAMKTLGILSFLYKCFEKHELYSYEVQYFKMASFLTNFVLDMIRQCDTMGEVNKSIWIMEKILNTCHFIALVKMRRKKRIYF